MTEFKVGDKVKHRTFGRGEIAFGPVNFPSILGGYLVKAGDGDHRVAGPEGMTLDVAFDVGDIVTLTTRDGARATVEYGPFDNQPVYVVKLVEPPADDSPRTFTALASMMEATEPVKVGDRVRVIVADPGSSLSAKFTGRIGVLSKDDGHRSRTQYLVKFGSGFHGDDDGTWYCASVEKVADEPADGFEYEGVTYEYGETYEDYDGDTWKFKRSAVHDQPVSDVGSYQSGQPLGYVVSHYSPLKKL